MSFFGWGSKRSREQSVREQDALLQSQPEDELPRVPTFTWTRQPQQQAPASYYPTTYPYRHQGNPYGGYYRFSPQFFGEQSLGGGGPSGSNVLAQSQHPQQSQGNNSNKVQIKPSDSARSTGPAVSSHPLPYYSPPPPAGYPGYGHYPYPYPYPYGPGGYPGPVASHPLGPVADQPPSEETDETETRTGLMNVEGRRPLFLVALFVVSIAVLLVSFPLTLLSAGYIGPLGLMFATGPFATVFAFWAIYLTPCECYPNVEWAVSRIRVFATTAAVFDAVGTIGVPISMYGAQCPDDDDTMLGCEDELPAAKGVSLAVAVVLGTHCFLCLLVRSNARKLAESKFGDERTEGIVLTPTPFGAN